MHPRPRRPGDLHHVARRVRRARRGESAEGYLAAALWRAVRREGQYRRCRHADHGGVPACRTLDCISVFALTVDDAWTAFTTIAGPDIADPYTRNRPTGVLGQVPPALRIGVPIKGERVFFGDQISAAQFEAAITRF